MKLKINKNADTISFNRNHSFFFATWDPHIDGLPFSFPPPTEKKKAKSCIERQAAANQLDWFLFNILGTIVVLVLLYN